MESSINFKSILAPYMTGLIQEKRSMGYSYKTQEYILGRFDAYCLENGLPSEEIGRDFLKGWMERRETEGCFNQAKRISIVRQLLMYMASCGIDVYIPHDFSRLEKVQPHIFDRQELVELFGVIDAYRPEKANAAAIRLADEYRLLFRLYCCCGLRNSEAASLAAENVDLETGVLTIVDAKGNRDRLVPMPDDLRDSCTRYYHYIADVLGFTPEWFFPGRDPHRPLGCGSVCLVFSRFWSQTRYAGCSNKPTVHDFRFTFVVERMNRWAEQGADLKVMMPYLSRYLGHKSTDETFYYYWLASDAYHTVAKNDTLAGSVIPEVVPYE